MQDVKAYVHMHLIPSLAPHIAPPLKLQQCISSFCIEPRVVSDHCKLWPNTSPKERKEKTMYRHKIFYSTHLTFALCIILLNRNISKEKMNGCMYACMDIPTSSYRKVRETRSKKTAAIYF